MEFKHAWGDLMKLYEVINKYVGETLNKCFIIAESEERALELARESFRNNSKWKYGSYTIDGERHMYPEDYWQELTAICRAEDTNKEYQGEVRDY